MEGRVCSRRPHVRRQMRGRAHAAWFRSRRSRIAPGSVITLAIVAAAATGAFPAGAVPSAGPPQTYFVSCAGNDHNDGTSAATPWASLRMVSARTFAAGDRILFERGCVWRGTLAPRSSGTAQLPIVVSAYGSGALPRFVGQDAPAVALRDVSNWIVGDLDLTQIGQRPQALDPGNVTGTDLDPDADRVMRAVVDVRALGPRGMQNCVAACRVRNITLEGLIVHDGQWDGIYVGAGYQDEADGVFGSVDGVTIQDVEARDNQGSGIVVAGTFTKLVRYEAANVRVLSSLAYGNGGDGIVLGQVDHGLIQGNRCAYNGSIRNASNGCWSWDSKDITIQFNQADHNMTPLDTKTTRDGGGFDLDMGSVDSVLQYNWSYDNQGEGYLLESWPIGSGYKCCISTNVTMRFNVSEGDGEKDAGSIEIYGGVRSAWIYNNTVTYTAARSAGSVLGTGGDLKTTSFGGRAGVPDANVANNIFVSDGSMVGAADDPLVTSDGKGRFRFDHNVWYRTEGGVAFDWGKAEITYWAGWQGRGFDPQGRNADPLLMGPPGSGPTGVELQPGSPAIGTGGDLTGAPAGMGGRDYFGLPVPQGARYDVGAVEDSSPTTNRGSNASPPSHQKFLTLVPRHGLRRERFRPRGRSRGAEGGRGTVAGAAQPGRRSPGAPRDREDNRLQSLLGRHCGNRQCHHRLERHRTFHLRDAAKGQIWHLLPVRLAGCPTAAGLLRLVRGRWHHGHLQTGVATGGVVYLL